MYVSKIKLCHICENLDIISVLVPQSKTDGGAEIGSDDIARTRGD